MEFKKEIKEFVIENFLFGDGEMLKEDTDFFKKGIIDSTGILELICFLEESFDITIEDDDITQKNFSSVNSVNNYLTKKINKSL